MYQYFCSVGVNVGVKQKKIKKYMAMLWRPS